MQESSLRLFFSEMGMSNETVERTLCHLELRQQRRRERPIPPKGVATPNQSAPTIRFRFF
jgi:hypothetical protein